MSERRRRIVPAQEAPAVAAWSLPPILGPVVNRRRGAGPDTAALEAAEREFVKEREAAQAAGYASGLEAGRAAGRAELEALLGAARASAARLEELLGFLTRPLDELDAEVERELVALTLAVGKQLARRELRVDPAQIIAIIRETVALLPVAARDVRVHLHPEDAAIVREHLPTPAAERAWSLVEDPVLARGGCRVTTDTASIDGRLESRVAAVAGAVLGEARSDPARDER